MTIFMASSNVGHLEDEALRRKERLKLLKRKREGGKISENGTPNSTEGESFPKPIFRSYKPVDGTLTELAVEPARPGDVSSEVNIFINRWILCITFCYNVHWNHYMWSWKFISETLNNWIFRLKTNWNRRNQKL